MTSLIRAGIVGAGLMGRWHAHNIGKVGGQIVGIVDRDTHSAQALAARYPGAAVYPDIQPLIDQGQLDVVHICTPAETHAELTRVALEAGIHVIVEKPLTPSAAGARPLFELAASKGKLLCPVHQFAFQDGVLKAQAWLPMLGDVVLMQGSFRSAGGAGLTAAALDGIAADILPHPLSLLETLMPGYLKQADWMTIRPRTGELYAIAAADRIAARIAISMNARPTMTVFEIVGTQGTIHLDLFHGFAFREPGEVSRTRKITHPFEHAGRQLSAASLNLAARALRDEPAYPGLRRLIERFYAAVRGEATPPISPHAAMLVADVRERLITHSSVPT